MTGEYVLDIRHFNMDTPKMPLFKLYPDVRLHLRLEARSRRLRPAARRLELGGTAS